MTDPKSLPARPSLESVRKQAKKLAREVAAGDAGAVARARAQLPHVALPLSQRNAQLVLAREYGFAGWQDLTAEVSKRLGKGLEWAAAQARPIIHDNDVERLKQLVDDVMEVAPGTEPAPSAIDATATVAATAADWRAWRRSRWPPTAGCTPNCRTSPWAWSSTPSTCAACW